MLHENDDSMRYYHIFVCKRRLSWSQNVSYIRVLLNRPFTDPTRCTFRVSILSHHAQGGQESSFVHFCVHDTVGRFVLLQKITVAADLTPYMEWDVNEVEVFVSDMATPGDPGFAPGDVGIFVIKLTITFTDSGLKVLRYRKAPRPMPRHPHSNFIPCMQTLSLNRRGLRTSCP